MSADLNAATHGRMRILVACARPIATRAIGLRVAFGFDILHSSEEIDRSITSILCERMQLAILGKNVEDDHAVYHLAMPLPPVKNLAIAVEECRGVQRVSYAKTGWALNVMRPGEEARAVRESLKSLNFSGDVVFLDHVKPHELRDLLDNVPGYDVLYLVCHGNEAGTLLLEDGRGWARHVDARELAEIVGGRVKILLLGACHGERALTSLLQSADVKRPYNIVFTSGEHPVPTRAVHLFCEGFFRSLVRGRSSKEAFVKGVERVRCDEYVGERPHPDDLVDDGPSPFRRFFMNGTRSLVFHTLAEGSMDVREFSFQRPTHRKTIRTDDIIMGREIATAVLVEELLPALTGVREEKSRLIHLHGEGGIGKTRLAQTVCDTLADYGHFLGGIYEVDCETVADECQLAMALIRTLGAGAPEMPIDPVAELPGFLREVSAAGNDVLLMLDNLDPLFVDERRTKTALLLKRILSECPQARILSTCRTKLNLGGYESDFLIDPLEAPVAVDLFMRCIPDKDIREELRLLSEEDMRHVVNLVDLLQGHPLSIFLAAHRISSGPEPVARQLVRAKERIVKFLEAPELTGIPARQRSLRVSLDLSCSLLSEAAKEIFRKCSFFPGGIAWDGSTVEEWEMTEWLEGLDEAAAKGLLRFERDEQRYRMLNPVREYAAELLNPEARNEFGRKVTKHWRRFAAARDCGLHPIQDPAVLVPLDQFVNTERRRIELAHTHDVSFAALGAEETNILSAFRWALENDADAAEGIATHMMDYFSLQGKRYENSWMAKAVLRVSNGPEVRAKWLNNLGNRLAEMGDRVGALEATQEALAIYRQLAEKYQEAPGPYVAMTLNNCGIHLAEMGDRAGALEATREALAVYRQLAERCPEKSLQYVAMTLNNLGNRLAEMGDKAGALEATRESLAIYRQLAESHPETFEPDVAMALNNFGVQLSKMGDRMGALEATREALAIYRRLAKKHPEAFLPDVAMTLNNLGNRLSEMVDRAGLLEATRESLAIYRQLAKKHPEAFEPDVATTLNNLGVQLSRMGDRAGALEATRQALAIRRQLAESCPEAFEPDVATTLHNLGFQLYEMGDRAGALDCFLELASAVRLHFCLKGYPEMAIKVYGRLAQFLPGLGNNPDVLPVLDLMASALEPLTEGYFAALEVLIRINERRIDILKVHDPSSAIGIAIELERQRRRYADRPNRE